MVELARASGAVRLLRGEGRAGEPSGEREAEDEAAPAGGRKEVGALAGEEAR